MQVLGFRITEMFKKSFRKEYLSLHEYKTCSLDIDVKELSENMVFSHTKRAIKGSNNGQTLVYFEYLNINNSVHIKFDNKLMNF